MKSTIQVHVEEGTDIVFPSIEQPSGFVTVDLEGKDHRLWLFFERVEDIERLVAKLKEAGNALAAMQPSATVAPPAEPSIEFGDPPANLTVTKVVRVGKDGPFPGCHAFAINMKKGERCGRCADCKQYAFNAAKGYPFRLCHAIHPPYSGQCEHCQPPSPQDLAEMDEPGPGTVLRCLVHGSVLNWAGQCDRCLTPAVEGEQSRPPSLTGSAASTEPTLPNAMPAGPDDVPAATCDCGQPVRGPGTLWCEACWAKLDKTIPF